MSIELNDYIKWVEANKPKHFSLFDYIHGVMKLDQVSIDVVFAISRLIWPEFILQSDRVFLKEEFSIKKYKELSSSGYEGAKLEYWMNLINISGLFESANLQQNMAIGNIICESWKSKLKQDFSDRNFDVRCTIDDGEVYVLFNQTE